MAPPVWAGDQQDVAAATAMWQDFLAKGTPPDPGPILPLYAGDGVLWGHDLEQAA